MELRGRALYNLLRFSWLEDPTLPVKPWQIEDYRVLATEELLKKAGLTEESFIAYAERCENPEELAELLLLRDGDLYEKGYLVLFELWRRLLPTRPSFSIFCDELDLRISLYDRGELKDEELMEDALADIEDLLDERVDEGKEPRAVFTLLSSYCAHNLEEFITDYISDQLDNKEVTFASELIDAFIEYISDSLSMKMLRARLFLATDPEDGNRLFRNLLEELQEKPDFKLLLASAKALVHEGDEDLFLQAVSLAIPLCPSEEEARSLAGLVVEYFRCLDKEEQETAAAALLKKRPVNLKRLSKILQDAQGSKV